MACVIVLFLASNPQCSSNLSSSGAVQENDVIVMTCSITYSGNWAPVMRWFNSVTRHNYSGDVIALTTNDTIVTSQLTVAASAGLHSSQIICVTYFTRRYLLYTSAPRPFLTPGVSPVTTNTETPSYTYEWTSPTLNVHCK